MEIIIKPGPNEKGTLVIEIQERQGMSIVFNAKKQGSMAGLIEESYLANWRID